MGAQFNELNEIGYFGQDFGRMVSLTFSVARESDVQKEKQWTGEEGVRRVPDQALLEYHAPDS